mmetsp:Transcript_7799/g.12259  ORF Transcript_7799/g.12259 Transcript_7799/m.12259 type:complete len:208 (+) Transcript_7799:286-909(+)
MSMVLLPGPLSSPDAAGVPCTFSSGLGALPSGDDKGLPAVCLIASTPPAATTASRSMEASGEASSAITASTTATGCEGARRKRSQSAPCTVVETHATSATLEEAWGATAAWRRAEQSSRSSSSDLHASVAESGRLASTWTATTLSRTLSIRLAAVTSYLSVLVTIVFPFGVACSSRRVTVPSTPDLMPYSTYTITYCESEYFELCTS